MPDPGKNPQAHKLLPPQKSTSPLLTLLAVANPDTNARANLPTARSLTNLPLRVAAEC